jgi:prepilin-type N-terminal cleavage/methylation domain-containing protein
MQYRVKTPGQNQSGFTLIELAIVIIVMGIILIPLIEIYTHKLNQDRRDTTFTNMTSVSNQLGYFTTKVTALQLTSATNVAPHLPCPSDRALAPNDPFYMKEFNMGDCTVAALAAMPAPLLYNSASPLPTCTANGGFCVVRGAKTDSAGVTTYAPVLVGGIPIKTIKEINKYSFADQDIQDGWEDVFTYAVTLSLTSGGDFSNGNGYISVVDEHDQPTAGIVDDGDYLLVSHGPNKIGTFTIGGAPTSLCGPILFAKDNENCNDDSKFVEAIGNYEANGATFYDDVVFAFKNQSSEIWANIPNPLGVGPQNVTNLNSGDIGIKTSAPTAKVEVAGYPTGSPGTVRVDSNARAAQICDKDGTNCFRVDALSSGSLGCQAGEYMKGIYSYTDGSGNRQTVADCVPFTITSPAGKTCPLDHKWLRGVNEDGSITCCGIIAGSLTCASF